MKVDNGRSYQSATVHREVARAWGLHGKDVVISVTNTGATDPTIAVIAKGREQEVLDRAWKKFGDGVTVLQIPERFK